MDDIHQLDKKPWIGGQYLRLSDSLGAREALVREQAIFRPAALSSADELRTMDEQLEQFVASNGAQLKPYFYLNATDERALHCEPRCQLRTYQLQLEHAKCMVANRAYKVRYLAQLASTRRELLMRHLALSNRAVTPGPAAPDQAASSGPRTEAGAQPSIVAILVVQIWPQPAKNQKVRLEREVLFRADQCLSDMRDQFKCQRDYGVPMDLSDDPRHHERIYQGELFKSGFFLVGDTLYSDLRDPNNCDLAANILDWAQRQVCTVDEHGDTVRVSRGIGQLKRARMEEHKFQDLKFRLGCPYLYLHQGDCEHLFTISDVRYVPNDAKLAQTRLPFVTATSIGRKKDNLRCYMCHSRPPHWYTRNNARLPIDPYFFCENCFYSFNYDKDKNKIGHFQAYLYTSAYGIPDKVIMTSSSG